MKITRTIKTAAIFALPMLFLMSSCGEDSQPSIGDDEMFDAEPLSEEEKQKEKERVERTRKIFYNIPSPMETASLLKKAGAEYDSDILNPIENRDKYTSSRKQALNLGVYGADLSYAGVFDRTSEGLLYTKCTRTLAEKLGVTSAFSEEVVDRLNANQNDRDSLLNIISETYWGMDGYLKENGREDVSAMMIVGGWVEGLYIATQIAKIADSPELRIRIAEQRLSLQDLSKLVSSYNKDNLNEVAKDLDKINSILSQVSVEPSESAVSEEDGVVVIGGGAPAATIDDALLEQLTTVVSDIRTRYIKG